MYSRGVSERGQNGTLCTMLPDATRQPLAFSILMMSASASFTCLRAQQPDFQTEFNFGFEILDLKGAGVRGPARAHVQCRFETSGSHWLSAC